MEVSCGMTGFDRLIIGNFETYYMRLFDHSTIQNGRAGDVNYGELCYVGPGGKEEDIIPGPRSSLLYKYNHVLIFPTTISLRQLRGYIRNTNRGSAATCGISVALNPMNMKLCGEQTGCSRQHPNPERRDPKGLGTTLITHVHVGAPRSVIIRFAHRRNYWFL